MYGIAALRARTSDGPVGEFSKAQIQAVCDFLKTKTREIVPDVPEDVLESFIETLDGDLRESLATKPSSFCHHLAAHSYPAVFGRHPKDALLTAQYIESDSPKEKGYLCINFAMAELEIQVFETSNKVSVLHHDGRDEEILLEP